MFEDRKDAGRQLGRALIRYKDRNPLVLAIPRGGVEVGYEVAKYLNADFSLIITRKLPFPNNTESGFGAIAEDGSVFIYDYAASRLANNVIEKIKKQQLAEIERRIKVLRQRKPLPDLKDRIVILIDDGIAMGSTMRASIMLCINKGAGKIVVATPVTGPDTAYEIGKLAHEIIVLKKPPLFRAVAQVYRNWYDVSDEEVLEIIRLYNEEKKTKNSNKKG